MSQLHNSPDSAIKSPLSSSCSPVKREEKEVNALTDAEFAALQSM